MIDKTFDTQAQYFGYNESSFLKFDKNPSETIEHWVNNFHVTNEVSWLNFHSISNHKDIHSVAQIVGMHPMSLEDIYTEIQRPKIEEFDNYLFFSVKSLLPGNGHQLKQEQISFTLGQDFLISFQEKPADHFKEVRARIEQNKGRIRGLGADYLTYKLLEAIIDNYYDVLDAVTGKIEKLDQRITDDVSKEIFAEIEEQKRILIELRKVVFPVKELFNQLEKIKSEFIKEENKYYFSDLKDSCMSVLDELDSNKSVLEGLTNTYFAVQGQKMNEIMKVLTIVGAIFIPLTFLAGIYGMNFDYIPETKLENGYYYFWIVIVLVAVLLLLYFKRKKWM
ncbi:MAG: magnesium/cobalt transporter CorA [Lishizhenia sp.]